MYIVLYTNPPATLYYGPFATKTDAELFIERCANLPHTFTIRKLIEVEKEK